MNHAALAGGVPLSSPDFSLIGQRVVQSSGQTPGIKVADESGGSPIKDAELLLSKI